MLLPKPWRFLPALLAFTACLVVAACGGTSHPTHRAPAAAHTQVPAYVARCPQAANGHGAPSICAPRQHLGLLSPHRRPLAESGSPQFLDLSNNDPCYCGAQIRDQGNAGLVVKANQGTGFRDWTMAGMVASARAAGLAVGGYDFDQDYTVAEAQVFVSQLQAAGIYPNTPNTFPAYLDVEYGNFSYGGLLAQIGYLRSQGYRVGIYTGEWYWSPNAGCQWPAGLVSAWLSGYPNASVPCGVYGYNAHQYTDSPVDRSVFFAGSFEQFVNAGPPPPPPDPYTVFPKTKFQFGHFRFDEYDAAKQYDHPPTGGPGCSHPFRRDICKRLGWEIHLLHQRLLFVAWHHRTAHGWARNRRPDYRTAHRGERNALLGRREVNRNPTWL